MRGCLLGRGHAQRKGAKCFVMHESGEGVGVGRQRVRLASEEAWVESRGLRGEGVPGVGVGVGDGRGVTQSAASSAVSTAFWRFHKGWGKALGGKSCTHGGGQGARKGSCLLAVGVAALREPQSRRGHTWLDDAVVSAWPAQGPAHRQPLGVAVLRAGCLSRATAAAAAWPRPPRQQRLG